MDDFITAVIVISVVVLYAIKLSMTHRCDDCGRKRCRCND